MCGPPGAVSRRNVLRGAIAAASGAMVTASAPTRPTQPTGDTGVNLRWLGVAGWELSFAGRHVLIDPYLSRLPAIDASGNIIPDYPLRSRTDLIDHYLTERPELILLTHGHYDHLLDVPYLMRKFTDNATHHTRVLGTETSAHLLVALGVQPNRIVFVSGGEYLDFQGFTVRVVRSLHSQLSGYGYFAPGTLTTTPAVPTTVSDLLEGGSVGYLVTVNQRFSMLFLSGTANFIESEVVGLQPNALIIGMSGHANVCDYPMRALRATQPRLLIPSHHDDMVTQLDDPKLPSRGYPQAAEELANAAARVDNSASVLDPEILRWQTL